MSLKVLHTLPDNTHWWYSLIAYYIKVVAGWSSECKKDKETLFSQPGWVFVLLFFILKLDKGHKIQCIHSSVCIRQPWKLSRHGKLEVRVWNLVGVAHFFKTVTLYRWSPPCPSIAKSVHLNLSGLWQTLTKGLVMYCYKRLGLKKFLYQGVLAGVNDMVQVNKYAMV